MAHQYDVMKVFKENRVDDIVDVRAQIEVGPAQMHAFTETGELRPVEIKPFLSEQRFDLAEGPTAAPRAMNDYYDWFRSRRGFCSLSIGSLEGRRQKDRQTGACKKSSTKPHSVLRLTDWIVLRAAS
jgi:hypothetical protein